MFKRKKVHQENYMSYFVGGTAVGMAAGLLAGKLFLNTLTEKTQNFESEIVINKNMNKYSQDDNIYNPYFDKNIQHNRTRSKSASQYEENCRKQTISVSPLNKFDDHLNNNINFGLNHKCNKDVWKDFYDIKNHTSHNISIEDNVKSNMYIDISLESSKERKENNYFKFEDIEQNVLCIAQLDDDASIKNKNLLQTRSIKSKNNCNEGMLKRKQIHECIRSTETFSTSSINFCEDSITYEDFKDTEDSMISSNPLPNLKKNISNIATCNDTTYFKDKIENSIDFTFMDEFCESDLISSTKQNNLENI